jgi:predicted permease
MNAHDLWLRLRALTSPSRVERELQDELDFHLEMQARKNLLVGMRPAAADRHARAQFGSVAFVKDDCRDARGIQLIETAWQDVRYAVRGFRRTPRFALIVIATIALALGLNAAVFTIFNAYVLRPVAVRDPYSLYSFTWANRLGRYHAFTWPEYEAFQRDNQVFSEVFAGRRQLVTRINGHPAYGQLVTGEYFRTLGVEAAVGRTLTPDDSPAPVSDAVVVLSYAFWQRVFASDPGIVGKKILIHGHPCEVVGVLRDGFSGLDLLPHDFWAPLTLDGQLEDGPDLFGPEHPGRLEIFGRLKAGISEQAAQAALTIWAQRTTIARPEVEKATGVFVQSQATYISLSPAVVLALSPILMAFTLVLIIACANVANMMLARAMARQREIGIRLSLGASRSRIVRQLLTESILLAIPAGMAGFAISQATVDFARRLMFATLPAEYAEYIRVAPLPADGRVLVFTLGAAVTSALLFGLAPAVQTTRATAVRAARGDFMYDFRPARLRNALVVAQITVSVLLLICAGVLLQGASRLAHVDVGLRTRDVLAIEIGEKSRARILAALESEPLVLGMAASTPTPFSGAPAVSVASGRIPGLVRASCTYASPDYFSVLDIPILSGRTFTRDESFPGAPVAIVSKTTASRLWPDHDAVGQSMRVIPDERTARGAQLLREETVLVIGVAGDVSTDPAKAQAARTGIYLPASPRDAGHVLLVRVKGDAEAARRALDLAMTAVDPGAISEIHKMQEFVVGRVYPFRAASWVTASVGALALLLAISGVYAVFSYVVTQRTREIGIRIALGATVHAVTGLVLRQSLRLAAIGSLAGAVLALCASRLFVSRFVMMATFDGFVYVVVLLLVFGACASAAYIPALRASRVDPSVTLRHD